MLEDSNKAAALQSYVEVWAKAQQWISEHPDEFAQAFYVEHEGLPIEDAKAITAALGEFEVPTNWDEVIARHQETADLLEQAQDREHLDVADIYDRRFEKAIAESLGASS